MAKYIGAVSSGSIRGCSRDCQLEHDCGSFRDFGGLAEIMRGGARVPAVHVANNTQLCHGPCVITRELQNSSGPLSFDDHTVPKTSSWFFMIFMFL